MGNETHRVKLNLLENVCLSLLGMSHSETQYSRFSSLLGKALTVATACEQWLWRFLSRDAAEVEAWAIYHCYESYHGTLQRVLNNKCSVPLHATQIYRTYIIQVFLLNLSVASSVDCCNMCLNPNNNLSSYLFGDFWAFGGVIFGIQLINPCLFWSCCFMLRWNGCKCHALFSTVIWLHIIQSSILWVSAEHEF